MPSPITLPARHPVIPHSRTSLTEEAADLQIQRGLFTVQRGVSIPIPVDRLHTPTTYLNRELWREDAQGRVFRPGTRMTAPGTTFQRTALAWLRDHVNENIPYWYYMATLGHDLHVSTWGDLYARHWHRGWANPFNPEQIDFPIEAKDGLTGSEVGFIEDRGWLSGNKVTDVFVNVEVGALVDSGGAGEAAEFNDFNEHEVGTSTAVESNNDTALTTTSGIALVAGTQVDDGGDPPTMTTVATITADVTETWEEHGVFSTTTDSLMDRSLTLGQSVNNTDQVQYTFTLTVNPEA